MEVEVEGEVEGKAGVEETGRGGERSWGRWTISGCRSAIVVDERGKRLFL